MRLRFRISAAVTIAMLAGGALPGAPQAPSPTAAVPGDQQVISLFQRIARYPTRLTPLLDQVHAAEWVAKGAPDTYATQLSSAKTQIAAIDTEMSALAGRPDQMQETMRALFRVQAFHRTLDSLMTGLRRYQNPALADLILSVAVEDQEDLSKLQDYILEVAARKEQEYLVVDHEAQRCRAIISKQPADAPRAVRRANP